MSSIKFLTKNDGKFRELAELLPAEFSLSRDETPVDELQTDDMDVLLRDKVLKAFRLVRRPLIVDHTGLQFGLLNGFPSGLTSIFYDKLGNDGIASIIGGSPDRSVTAITLIGYCDGRAIHTFRGEARGTVAARPRGDAGFQWDTIFVPEGFNQTYAELGQAKKNEISMRRRAFDQFASFLRGGV
jgi:XTP/dITP diphosphohydrolase